MTNKKQLKISRMIQKGVMCVANEIEDIKREILDLQQKLKERQDEVFKGQLDDLPLMPVQVTDKSDPFVKPQKIVLANSVEGLNAQMKLTSMLTGVEVQSYEVGDHCCVAFHMQHDTDHEITHGLRIDMKKDANVVSKSSMPLGFNLDAVLEDFDNIMIPECLGAIRKALVAYYDRLQQFDDLKKMLNVEAQMFKVLDGSHVEIMIDVENTLDIEEEERATIILVLEYRVYDIRPKKYSFKEFDQRPEHIIALLQDQCAVFKKKSLRKAFRDVFITGIGPYKLVQQVGANPEEKQARRNKLTKANKDYNNDDTFQPEDCSVGSDE